MKFTFSLLIRASLSLLKMVCSLNCGDFPISYSTEA